MEHLFDTKKFINVAKDIMKKTEDDRKISESAKKENTKKVEIKEAVGVSNTERRAALDKIKTYSKGGAAIAARNSDLAATRDRGSATAKTVQSIKTKDDREKTKSRGFSKEFHKSADEYRNQASLRRNASKVVHKESYAVGEIIDHEEYGEGAIVSFNDTELEVVFDHGIEVFEIEEDYHPSIEFHLLDKNDHAVGKYKSIQRARNAKEKRAKDYGGEGHGHRIAYFHKDKNKYVEFSQTGPDSK